MWGEPIPLPQGEPRGRSIELRGSLAEQALLAANTEIADRSAGHYSPLSIHSLAEPFVFFNDLLITPRRMITSLQNSNRPTAFIFFGKVTIGTVIGYTFEFHL